jgi:integrase
MKNQTELPEGLYRRKDSPYIWAKFKVKGMAKPLYFSTETPDAKLAEMRLTAKRGNAIEGKLTGAADKIGLRAMVKRALALMKKNESYERSVMNVVDWLAGGPTKEIPAHGITPERIEQYDAARQDSAALSTINRELGYLQSCFNVAINKMKLQLDDPVKGFARHDESPLARDRYLTYEERQKLFSDPKLSPLLKDVYMFAMKTGLRQGEQCTAPTAIKWVDVNWADRTVKVLTLKKKKRGAAAASKTFRHVPLHAYCLDILKRRRAEGWDKRSPFIFCDEDGTQLHKDGQLVTALEFACKRNGIENFHYHDFRHTFATDFLRAARDLKAFKVLSEIMGHSLERMTAKYSHLFPEDKMDQINLLPAEPAFQPAQSAPKAGYVQVTLPK